MVCVRKNQHLNVQLNHASSKFDTELVFRLKINLKEGLRIHWTRLGADP